MLKRIAAATLGCKVNYYDTERLLARFTDNGWAVVDFGGEADVYFVNTCAVTATSCAKSRQMIRKAKSRGNGAIIAAAGCYPATERAAVEALNVDILLGTKDRDTLYDRVVEILGDVRGETQDRTQDRIKDRTRAFVKVQDGCDNFCSYCVIPYARGRVVSCRVNEVENEVRTLAAAGYKEVVVTGVCLSAFGRDTGERLDALIGAVCGVDGVERVRLSSLEPTVVTDEFVSALARFDKLCPHFHLSLQSGCDKTLAAMNRRYTAGEYAAAVKLLRSAWGGAGITTDVIAGFPGETEDDFDRSLSFIESVGFSRVHAFPFSVRAGTAAEKLPNQVGKAEKAARTARVIEVGERMAADFMSRFIGTRRSVLLEYFDERRGAWFGYTDNYMPVYVTNGEAGKNDVVSAALLRREGDFLRGACE